MQINKKFINSVQAQIGRAKYQTIVNNGKHSLVADEPDTVGGGDTGMDPDGLLLASLASCTLMTLRMYIDRKMWLVDEIEVNVELYKAKTGTIIERQLSFKGELSGAQKTRLVQIANACPIHKILTGSIVIETSLK